MFKPSLAASLMLASCLSACQPAAVQPQSSSVLDVVRDHPAAPSASTAVRNSDALYSDVSEQKYPTQVYWGDTHLHSNFSMDAYTFGTTLGPDDAYRFAKGETVMATHGQPARLERPLDFLVLADHADALGAMLAIEKGNKTLLANPQIAEWKKWLDSGEPGAGVRIAELQSNGDMPAEVDDAVMRGTAWDYIVSTADAHYEPGQFTPLIGYEWTAQKGGNNLHRVVVYRDGADKTRNIMPLSPNESDDPRTLWNYLNRYEETTGGNVLAIPHNGNLSNGIMFPLAELEFGGAMDGAYVKSRNRWEPVYEVTQIKGDGETHPYLSTDDEFANYETWDFGDFAGVPKTDDMLASEYARSALKRGLLLEEEFGVNPYKFGMIGSTDSHTTLSTADEDNFFGKHSAGMEPGPERWSDPVGGRGEVVVPGWMMAASGYAAVWAKENTREEIFDAIQRREVYATTGPRMTVRFFGGWDFKPSDVVSSDFIEIGYSRGVPMGSDLPAAQGDVGPTFMIAAMKDPMGGNLDRVQIVKGWLDSSGETQEKVYDVEWSNRDSRQKDAEGKVPATPSSVDIEAASYTHEHGAAMLSKTWQDPDFKPNQSAFYYARVIAVPTPRWTAYDAARFDIELPDHIPMMTQERAYSSPIWYNSQ